MIAELAPIILGGIFGLLGTIYTVRAGVQKVRSERAAKIEDDEAESRKLKPPTFLEMWAIVQKTQESHERLAAEFDTFKDIAEAKDRAIGNVLRDLSDQWPGDRPPLLNSRDIEALQDTIPAKWLHVRDDSTEVP